MQESDFQHLKAGIYLANPMTGATKAITSGDNWGELFGFASTGNASVSIIAASVAWVYAALEIRNGMLGEIAYSWELNGKPIDDSQLPFTFDTMQYIKRADKALQLVGNSYLGKVRSGRGQGTWSWVDGGQRRRKIYELQWLDPRAVTPDKMSATEKTRFRYGQYFYDTSVGTYTRRINLSADDIIRTYQSGLNSQDPDSAAADAYNLAAQIIWGMDKTTDGLYDTNGLPPVIVKVSPNTLKSARDAMQKAFRGFFGRKRDGRGNKVLTITNDVEISTIALTPKDLAQDTLSNRQIKAIYAVNLIPMSFLADTGDRAKAVEDTARFLTTMAARFQMLADELNNDVDIKKLGLKLLVKQQDHYSMKKDMGIIADSVQKNVNSGMTLEAALFFNGVGMDFFPDGMQVAAMSPVQETAVLPPEIVEADEGDVSTTDSIKADELAQLNSFIRKGTHKKRPFIASHLPLSAIKAEITAQNEADLAQLESELQELVVKAANNDIDEDTFKEEYLALFLAALVASAAAGAAGDMTAAGVAELAVMESQARESIDNLSSEIYAGRYSAGGVHPSAPDSQPFNAASEGQTAESAAAKIVNRVSKWGASITGAFWLGNVFSEANSEEKEMWVLGIAEHCPDCLRLDGQVHTAAEWSRVIRPKSPDLACTGRECQCSLVPVPSDTPTRGNF